MPARLEETDRLLNLLSLGDKQAEVDPILWTKKGHSLATLLPVFLTGNSWLILLR